MRGSIAAGAMMLSLMSVTNFENGRIMVEDNVESV
jgi:hypothetical protein